MASLENGYDVRTVQDRLGHQDIKRTTVYPHAQQRGGRAAPSPHDPS